MEKTRETQDCASALLVFRNSALTLHMRVVSSGFLDKKRQIAPLSGHRISCELAENSRTDLTGKSVAETQSYNLSNFSQENIGGRARANAWNTRHFLEVEGHRAGF